MRGTSPNQQFQMVSHLVGALGETAWGLAIFSFLFTRGPHPPITAICKGIPYTKDAWQNTKIDINDKNLNMLGAQSLPMVSDLAYLVLVWRHLC